MMQQALLQTGVRFLYAAHNMGDVMLAHWYWLHPSQLLEEPESWMLALACQLELAVELGPKT